MKVRPIYCVLIAVAGFFACNTQKKENEKLKSEIISIHDEVMPLMGELKTYQNEFLSTANELIIADSMSHAAKIAELKKTAVELDEAYQGMFVWMRQFEVENEGMTEKEVENYLKDQKIKAEKVNADIKNALKKAERLKE